MGGLDGSIRGGTDTGPYRAGAKGNQPARWPAPTLVSGMGDDDGQVKVIEAIPGRCL